MTATLPDPPELDPAELAGHGFSRTRKGFEPVEVHSTLGRAADALRAWSIRDEYLRERVADLEARLDESDELDEDRITKVLGEETARIVTAARDAAAEIRTKATDQAALLLSETEATASAAAAELTGAAQKDRDEAAATLESARAEAQQLRDDAAAAAAQLDADARERHDALIAEAEAVLSEKVSEAEAAAAGITETAEAELSMARTEGERVRSDASSAAEQILDTARDDGRAMLEEAKQVRERILRDLADRRRTARRQIEAARAGRDEILELLRTACAEASGTVESLAVIDGEVQRAADDAASAIDVNIDAEVAELEATMMAMPEPDDRHVVVSSTHTETDIVSEEILDGEVVAVDVVHYEDDVTTVLVEDDTQGTSGIEVVEVSSTESAEFEIGESELSDPEVSDSEIPEAEIPAAAGSPAESSSDDSPVGDSPVGERDVGDEGQQHESAQSGLSLVANRTDMGGADDDAAVDEPSANEPVLDDTVLDDTVLDDTVLAEKTAAAGDGTEMAVDDSESDEDDDAAEGESGATVHDLFARLRAEGLEPDEEVDAGAGGESDDAASASIDLTSPVAPAATDPSPVAAETPVGDAGANDREQSGGHVATIVAEDPGQLLLDRRDEMLLPVEKAMGRLLKRLVSDEQNEILDRLRRVKRGRPDADVVLPDVDAGVEVFTDTLLAEFTESVDAGSKFWQELSGASADALFDDDEDLRSTLSDAIREFLDLHRAHLDRTFAESDEAGLDASELGDRIRSSYRDLRSSSLADFTGDLLTVGFALGERRAAGPGAQWRWVVDNGGLPCADGEDNALAGAVGCGEEFPTGDVTPPAHPGCRCVLAPAHS